MVCGYAIIFLVVGGISFWSVFAPLNSAAIATGVVTVDSNHKTIKHLEGGVVRTISVHDGDRVFPGQVLIELDGEQVRSAMTALMILLATNRAQQARLIAESNGLEQIPFPTEMTQSINSKIAQIMVEQQQFLDTRRTAMLGNLKVLGSSRSRAKAIVRGLAQQIVEKRSEVALMTKELMALKGLSDQDLVPILRVSAAKRSLAELQSDLFDLEAKRAQADEEIDGTVLEEQKIKAEFRRDVEGELQKVAQEGADLEERMRTTSDQFRRLQVRAPVAGTVVNMAIHTVGGVITPGEPILDIVPDNDRLVIQAFVQPTDIESVAVGMPAEVRFPAFSRTRHQHLDGAVSMVSADRLIQPVSGTPYYLVRVRVNQSELAKLGLQGRLLPGMPAEVIIIKGQSTALDYLIEPMANVFRLGLRQ